jgi:hypothetical protein
VDLRDPAGRLALAALPYLGNSTEAMLPKPLKAPQWAFLGFAWSKGKGKMDYLDEYKKHFGNSGALIIKERNGQ